MSSRTVLFVDDDERVLRAWQRSFSDEPYTMVFATSGHAALSLFESLRISAVVTDYAMSEGNGLDLLQQVKRTYPDTLRILVSGQATLKVASSAINECGIFRLFEKPCSAIDLAVGIREGLAHLTEDPRAKGSFEELRRLESEHPGITRVKRGRGGVVIV